MRTIDADRFLEEVKLQTIEIDIPNNENIQKLLLYEQNALMKCVFDTLNKQPTVGEWIPCDKKLPKESGTYLVTIQYGENRIQQVKKFSDDLYHVDEFDFGEYKNKKHCGWYDYDSEWGFCEIDNVIAWKPLGEEYKGE